LLNKKDKKGRKGGWEEVNVMLGRKKESFKESKLTRPLKEKNIYGLHMGERKSVPGASFIRNKKGESKTGLMEPVKTK